MLGFGLGLSCAVNFPGPLDTVFRPFWDLLVTRTGVTIAGRPASPRFLVTNVRADGATIKRG